MPTYALPKPATVTGYALHRLVAGLVNGAPYQYRDAGDRLLVRTSAPLQGDVLEESAPKPGAIRVFQLRASVGYKTRGRHRYYPLHDWRSRRAWLEHQATRHGFEILAVHVESAMARVEKGGRVFTVDRTDFTGALKVVDVARFTAALAQGIGSTARAFGSGMLVIS